MIISQEADQFSHNLLCVLCSNRKKFSSNSKISHQTPTSPGKGLAQIPNFSHHLATFVFIDQNLNIAIFLFDFEVEHIQIAPTNPLHYV